MTETVLVKDILIEERIRKDFGELDKLADSIKTFGVIQPIVLTNTVGRITLVAGGRRLAAVKRLGIKELRHGFEYIWRGEETKTIRQAVELEENLRRKELTWQEELAGKAKLLELMQQIKGGTAKVGPIVSTDTSPGFGINRLAAMLGESTGKTSQDIQLARAIQQVPALGKLKNKSEAFTKLRIVGAVVSMQRSAVPQTAAQKWWTLYEEDFRTGGASIPDDSVDLIWTDLPYGADIGDMSGQAATSLAGFDDSRRTAVELLDAVAAESFRVLRKDRFAVFCFGFTFYPELLTSMARVGFNVNVVPFVWVKNSKSGENPNTRYCNGYEPLLVVSKGNPQFIRPGSTNVFESPIVTNKLQSVQKPTELVEKFILDTTGHNGVVVDWCAGTGTTGVACHNLKRHAILFERDSRMATIAKARLGALK